MGNSNLEAGFLRKKEKKDGCSHRTYIALGV
jgi:hypothetical protein